MKNPSRESPAPPLPGGFVQNLSALLGMEAEDFFASYNKPPLRGLRLNPQKLPEGGAQAHLADLWDAVPWEPWGRYIGLDSPAGLHPLHEAGAWYLQEPSAMAAAAALDPKPGEWVADLCAAPGGKSGQIAARLKGSGLLVSNEIVPSRAQVLSRNLERLGITNALVTCEEPARLAAKWPGLFDRVLADAPCSGEGMFRRHPQTRLEWTEKAPEACARRQGEILRSAARMVRPGGFLCYSTCTFGRLEDEGVVEAFLKENPDFALQPFRLSPEADAGDGMLRLWPHKVRGEGHFIALLKKRGCAQGNRETVPLPSPGREERDAYAAFCRENLGGDGPVPSGLFAGRLALTPELPDLRGVKALRCGLHLGQLAGKRFLPDHAWALSTLPPQGAQRLALSLAQAEAYLKGEALPAPPEVSGWVLVRYAGLALGWGKVSEGRVQNHYPKGLRRG